MTLTFLISTAKEWQTLISGLLAILAALLGGCFIIYQTKQQEISAAKRDARVREATRAALPIVLGGVLDWCEEIARSIMQMHQRREATPSILNPPTVTVSVPAFPASEISQMQEAIAILPPAASTRLIEIIHKIQVSDARIRTGADGVNGVSRLLVLPDNIQGYALDVAEVHALAESLYPYGRGQSPDGPSTPPPIAEALKALHVLGFDSLNFPDPNKSLELRLNRKSR